MGTMRPCIEKIGRAYSQSYYLAPVILSFLFGKMENTKSTYLMMNFFFGVMNITICRTYYDCCIKILVGSGALAFWFFNISDSPSPIKFRVHKTPELLFAILFLCFCSWFFGSIDLFQKSVPACLMV